MDAPVYGLDAEQEDEMFTMPTIDMVATGRNIRKLREAAGPNGYGFYRFSKSNEVCREHGKLFFRQAFCQFTGNDGQKAGIRRK